MSDIALPNAAWPPGMVTVAELLRRLAPVPGDAAAAHSVAVDLRIEPDAERQLPIETLLRREGRQTGAIPTQRPPSEPLSGPLSGPLSEPLSGPLSGRRSEPWSDPQSAPPARRPLSGRSLRKVAVVAGAVAAAGSAVAGGLLLSQHSNAQHPVVDTDRGSYPGQGASETLPPADSLMGTDPFQAPGSAFSAAFPNPAAPAAGTIPATGGGAVPPAGSNGAPSPAVPPAAGGGAPPAADEGSSAVTGAEGGAGDTSQPSSGRGGDGGHPSRGGGPIGNTLGKVTGTVESVGGGLVGTVGGLL